MRRKALLAVAGVIFTLAPPAAAEEQRVMVLMSRQLSAQPWPEGTQAVIAELAARNYQVVVVSSDARGLNQLLEELQSAARGPATSAAIALVRDGSLGIAYVWTRRDGNVLQVQAETSEGAVGEGALALRVTELIRARDLALPAPPAETTPAPIERPAAKPMVPPAAEPSTPPLLWLGAGPTFVSGTDAPLIAAVLGVRVPIGLRPLALDASAAISITPLKIGTSAGTVEVSARQATLHLLFDPWSASALNLALGAGVGAVWLDETARANAGYVANADDAYVGLLSLRARGSVKSGNLSLVLTLEPGVLLPGASIRASDDELSRIGRPWTTITAGIGWIAR
jgi:hypothetical protein